MLKIAHLSDTHIRNFKRHWEYRKSYEYLYDSLRENEPDVIIITGDVAHTKTQISPEFVQLCTEYFKNLADIATLCIVPGNHDGNLNNLTRLDALTPIVEAINLPEKIRYFKKSGVYTVNLGMDLPIFNLVVFSCFDNDWPTETSNNLLNIGAYHGFIKNAELSNGILIEDGPSVKDFLKIVDYLLLGDLHKHQVVDPKYRAAYAGSYPQQNFAEDPIYKGYLLWEIKSKTEHEAETVSSGSPSI